MITNRQQPGSRWYRAGRICPLCDKRLRRPLREGHLRRHLRVLYAPTCWICSVLKRTHGPCGNSHCACKCNPKV